MTRSNTHPSRDRTHLRAKRSLIRRGLTPRDADRVLDKLREECAKVSIQNDADLQKFCKNFANESPKSKPGAETEVAAILLQVGAGLMIGVAGNLLTDRLKSFFNP
jgi:hypothetical protein